MALGAVEPNSGGRLPNPPAELSSNISVGRGMQVFWQLGPRPVYLAICPAGRVALVASCLATQRPWIAAVECLRCARPSARRLDASGHLPLPQCRDLPRRERLRRPTRKLQKLLNGWSYEYKQKSRIFSKMLIIFQKSRRHTFEKCCQLLNFVSTHCHHWLSQQLVPDSVLEPLAMVKRH